LRLYLHDNNQAWEMDSEGQYAIHASRRVRACAQEALLALLATED
jgi:polyphosphate kinase